MPEGDVVETGVAPAGSEAAPAPELVEDAGNATESEEQDDGPITVLSR